MDDLSDRHNTRTRNIGKKLSQDDLTCDGWFEKSCIDFGLMVTDQASDAKRVSKTVPKSGINTLSDLHLNRKL
eukprot:895924-Amphidinium_carterae.1